MRKWNRVKKEDIEVDCDDLNMYIGHDEGAIYGIVKIKLLREILSEVDDEESLISAIDETARKSELEPKFQLAAIRAMIMVSRKKAE